MEIFLQKMQSSTTETENMFQVFLVWTSVLEKYFECL